MRGKWGCSLLQPLRPQEEAPSLQAEPGWRGGAMEGHLWPMTIVVKVPVAADRKTQPPGAAATVTFCSDGS